MRPIYILVKMLCVGFLLNSCSENADKGPETGILKADLRYVSLDSFKYKPARIRSGDELELFTGLRGKENLGDTVYYHQFMAVNKRTYDTVRIFCPEIIVDLDGKIENQSSSSPLSYEFKSGVTTAFYEPLDTSRNLLLNSSNLEKLVTKTDSIDIEHMLNSKNAVSILVLHKNDTERKIFRYGTAIGILRFKQVPW